MKIGHGATVARSLFARPGAAESAQWRVSRPTARGLSGFVERRTPTYSIQRGRLGALMHSYETIRA